MNDSDFNEIMQNNIIVIYDGVCGFCNTSIQFILKQTPNDKMRFVAFQSETGKRIRNTLNIHENLDSIIVVENNEYFKKSKAIFRILNQIQSSWKHLRHLSFVPAIISDFFYDIIAKNRYRIQKNTCPIPSSEERKLFI